MKSKPNNEGKSTLIVKRERAALNAASAGKLNCDAKKTRAASRTPISPISAGTVAFTKNMAEPARYASTQSIVPKAFNNK